MKALSVRQPWAHLIFRETDRKDVENRSWTTQHRGPLVIHASKTWDPGEYEAARHLCLKNGYQPPPKKYSCRRGRILGVVTLEDVLHDDDFSDTETASPWHVVGQHAWLLENPQRLTYPIEASGQLGLWDVPLDTAQEIAAQMSSAIEKRA